MVVPCHILIVPCSPDLTVVILSIQGHLAFKTLLKVGDGSGNRCQSDFKILHNIYNGNYSVMISTINILNNTLKISLSSSVKYIDNSSKRPYP